jgi:hypothetical protein
MKEAISIQMGKRKLKEDLMKRRGDSSCFFSILIILIKTNQSIR